MPILKEKILILFPAILISLIPIFLITGPFLSDLSVVLVGIFFLINVQINKEYQYFKNKFFIIFLIFFLYLFFNSLLKYYDLNNLRISLGYLRFGLFALGVFYFLDKKKEIINWLFYTFLISFIALIVDGFIQFGFKVNLFNVSVDLSGRISSLFGSEYIMGSYLSRLFPIFLGITFYLYKDNYKFIFSISIIFVLIEILIFLSGERAAFFFNTLSALYIIIMIKNFKKIRLFSLITSFLLIILISTYDNTAKQRIWDSTINQMGINTGEYNIFSEVHQSHYESAYKMYLDNKVIGIGVRNFRNFCSDIRYDVLHERSCTTHPHNTYIQILAETGLIGLGFILLVLFCFIYFSLKHLRGIFSKNKYYFTDFEVCLLSAILVSIWPFVPSGNFFNNWLSIIYYFPIGFLLWSFDKKIKKF